MHPVELRFSAPFVDAHVHTREGNALDCAAAAGVTAVRDAGARVNTEGVVQAQKVRANGPLVVSSGWALYKKGGYGSLFGVSVETREEIKSEIFKLKGAGAGIIKIIASGMVSLKQPDTITPGGFDGGEIEFIVEEAGGLGLSVMAHANGEAAIMAAAAANVRSIEHGFFMTEHALDMMAKKKIYWTPTVGALARAAEASSVSPETRKFISDRIRKHVKMIQHAYSIGVPLAVGTDCVLPDPEYRKIYDAELSYFERAGISRQDVLRIACEGGATLLGLSNIL